MCFEWDGKYYEFNCLAQGATCSPQIFVKLTTPLMKRLREQLVSIMIYIDDTLIMARSLSEMKRSMRLTIECLEKVGFLGGLSLHLNHLIASRTANYDWPFGTLPFGLFGSNLDTRDLETHPRTYSGHF